MAMSKDTLSLTERIKGGIDFTNQTKADLEERFGLLYSKGKPKELSVEEKQKLKLLYKALDALKISIENFQTDSSEVCGVYEDRLKPFDMRPEKGRAAARDSGIESGYMPSPQSSCNTLSRSNTGNVDSKAEHTLFAKKTFPEETEDAEMYNPSSSSESSGNSITDKNSNDADDIISNINDNALDKNTGFYLGSPLPSTTSLTGCSFASTAEVNTTKEVNDLNTTLSDVNNANQD